MIALLCLADRDACGGGVGCDGGLTCCKAEETGARMGIPKKKNKDNKQINRDVPSRQREYNILFLNDTSNQHQTVPRTRTKLRIRKTSAMMVRMMREKEEGTKRERVLVLFAFWTGHVIWGGTRGTLP